MFSIPFVGSVHLSVSSIMIVECIICVLVSKPRLHITAFAQLNALKKKGGLDLKIVLINIIPKIEKSTDCSPQSTRTSEKAHWLKK